MEEKNLPLKLGILYFLLFSGFACFFPFQAIYFKARGLNYVQTGICFGLVSLISIIAQPTWGFITDKYLNKKKTLLLTLFTCSFVIYVFIIVQNFYFIALSIIILTFFQSPTSPITDAFCYDIMESNKSIQYGRIRLLGSLSFALIALLIGKLIQATNINICFYIYSLFFLFTAIILLSVKFNGNTSIQRPNIKDIVDILRNYRFLIFILSVTTVSIALGAHSSYIAVLIEKTGGNVATLGTVWFIQAICELPLFFFGARLIKKFGELNIYLTAVFLYIIRFLLSSLCVNYTMVIAVQMMQGITLPLYLMGSLQHINIIVPSKIKASGITLLTSLGFGLGGLIGNLFGGIILQTHSIFYLYKLATLTSVLSFLIGLGLKHIERKYDIKKQTSI